jgi:hypothetical protein
MKTDIIKTKKGNVRIDLEHHVKVDETDEYVVFYTDQKASCMACERAYDHQNTDGHYITVDRAGICTPDPYCKKHHLERLDVIKTMNHVEPRKQLAGAEYELD